MKDKIENLVSEAVCKRCGHKWKPRLENPKMCPKCISKYWSIEKTVLSCALCSYKWTQKKFSLPRECPRCGSENWNSPEFRMVNEALVWLEEKIRTKEEIREAR